MKKIVSLFTLLLTTLASWAIDDGVPHALAQQRSREIRMSVICFASTSLPSEHRG